MFNGDNSTAFRVFLNTVENINIESISLQAAFVFVVHCIQLDGQVPCWQCIHIFDL